MEPLVYLFDGTFEGLLCCVFRAFVEKEIPEVVSTEEMQQLLLGQTTQRIATDPAHAQRVQQGFARKAGQQALTTAITAYHSGEEDKAYSVFRYLCLGFHIGRKITSLLAHPTVLKVQEMEQKVLGEVHLLKGFIRLQAMKNGVYFARLSPKSFALPFLMPHFVDRFSIQPLVLYDETHKVAGIYDTKEWKIFHAKEPYAIEFSQEEKHWQSLWQSFFSSITITERTNQKLQTNQCPKRYRSHMTEFQVPIRPTVSEGLPSAVKEIEIPSKLLREP